jgi:hypothetical protein
MTYTYRPKVGDRVQLTYEGYDWMVSSGCQLTLAWGPDIVGTVVALNGSNATVAWDGHCQTDLLQEYLEPEGTEHPEDDE